MMAQTRSSSYDEKLEQLYGRAPFAQEINRDAFSEGDDWSDAPNYGYGILNGQFVKFTTEPTSVPSSAGMQFEGYDFVSAEIVAFNSTTDHIYAYASDGRFCLIDPQANEITVLGNGDPLTELAYDVTTKTMYGLRYGVLYTVNMEDGSNAPVNEMLTGSNNWVALAIDMEGNMYGIINTFSDVNADMYKINTVDWNSTKVGTLPYRTQYAQSMSFDRDNGTLYWWQASTAGFNFLKVNPQTAACTNLWPNNGYQVSGMFFKYSPITYPITYEVVENGTFSGPAMAAENDVVEVTVTPDYGYRLGTLTWNGNDIDVEAGEPYTFTMVDEPVTVSGSFLLSLHNIIVLDPKDGTLATDPENEGFYSTTIQVLPTPDPGFGVTSITYVANGETNTITAEPYEFIMPDYDVTVSAVYEQTGVNTVFIGTDYYGYFDDIVTVAVEMDNENLVAGTQMDIALGENLTFVPGSLTLSDRAEGDSWVIAGNIIGNNVLRVNTFNNDLSYYAGTSGIIFTFQVQCARVVSNNTLAISGLIAGTPDATNLNIEDIDGALEIKDVVMNQPENIVVCHNTEVGPVAFGTTIEETEGPITYAWTNDNSAIGLAEAGEGDIAAFTATNTTNATAVANLTVTPTLVHNGNPCVGSTLEFTITVNPQVVMETPENQVVCNGTSTAEVVFGTSITDGEMTYAWTNDNAEIGLAAEGTGNIAAFEAVNAGNAAVVANIEVTPTYANNDIECVGEPVNFTIQVNPTPVMVAIDNQVVCNGEGIEAIEFASNITDGEMHYMWTCDTPAIGCAAAGQDEFPAFTAVNEGGEAITATFVVTPYYTNEGITCAGEAIEFTITVNPTPVMEAVNSQVVCNGDEVAAVVFASNITDDNVTYAWTNNNTEIGLGAEGTGNIAAFTAANLTGTFAVANIIVTPTYTNAGVSCVGEPIQFTITVNPTPVMEAVNNQVVCNESEVAAIVFASNITDENVTYAWTNNNTEIGLAAAGEGNIDAFTAVNEGNAAVVATIEVTPTYTNAGVSCVGEPIQFTIQVNPTPVMVAIEDQVVCNGAETEAVVFASNITDGEMHYMWICNNSAIGCEEAGQDEFPAFTAVNEGNAAVTATITVTPYYTNAGITCAGDPIDFSIQVNPTPVMVAIEDQVVCNGSETAEVVFASNVTDGEMHYLWTCDNNAIGCEAAGQDEFPAFTAVNEGNAAVTANFIVTPYYTNAGITCAGEAIEFSITVNPTPVMVAIEDQVVCNGTEIEAIEFASNITDGTMNYMWTCDNSAIGCEAAGQDEFPAFTAVNEGNEAVTANFIVTPYYTNAGITCAGEAIEFSITVNPTPVMVAVENMVVCDNNEVSVTFASNITDGEVTYAWTNDNTEVGLAAAGEGNIEFVSANVNGEPLVANIVVTPTYTNNGISCVGEAMSFTITVYPTPVMDPVADQTIYSRESTEDIIFTSNITDSKVIFNWVNDNPAIGLAAEGTGNIMSFVGAAPITTTQVAHITVTPLYSDITTCEGASITFTITVEPTYLVVIADGIENGTLTDNAHVAANGEHYAIPGEEITLTATPAEGYLIENVTAYMLTNNLVNVPVENDETFIMPEFDVEANATFIDDDNLLIKPGTIDLGFRPINAWMYSKFFDATNISAEDFDITEMDLTDYTFFALDEVELPFTIEAGQTAQFGINTNYKNVAPGLKNTTLAMIAQHSRKPYMRNVVANAYTPVEPDVWELATNVTSYPYVTTQATAGVIYDNYQLPGETPDGYDGVYKLVFDHDVILNAEITDGENAKVVLYDNGFNQVGGPHTNNYHNAPLDMDNMATIGEGLATTNYAPYFTYYNYAMSQVLYRADELAAAGLMPGKLTSIEYSIANNTTYTRTNVSIWMANVTEDIVNTTSVNAAGMAKVFTGTHVQVPGWNEFVFNGDEFAWDGSSNILVTFVTNHGSYNSQPHTAWHSTNPGFYATSYAYRDNAPYYPDQQTYTLTRSSNARPNTKFNGMPIQNEGEPCDGSPIVEKGLFAGTYYLVASTTSDDSYTLEINADDIPLPMAPTAIYPAHEAQGIETPVTFQFELGEYTHEYQLLLGTQYNNQEVVVDWTSDLTGTFNAGELLHNTIYFWRINERNSSGVTEGPVWAFTTELNVPQNLAVVEEELFEGDDAVLTWDNVADRTILGYNIYQDGIKINDTPVTENTYTVSGLTYNLEGYVFNVTAAYSEGESDFSNNALAYFSGYGTISGFVYEQDGTTGIAGATVTIIGFDDFDELVDYEYITNANGAYTGTVHAGYYFGLANKEGYQTTGDNIGVEVEYQGTTSNYNFILNENYNAVTRVVAEEIDANNVHVFWGWDMIEDFETGDFSAYEWVNNGTYPWVITNNAYEGSYAMKSTGEGVASVQSAIEITMTNEKDGMLSFFYKISSESNYDKGIFYVDGVAKTTVSGTSNWSEKQVAVTAGTHTYKWSYEKDGSVNSNDDCFYVDYINFFFEPEPLPEGSAYFDFETGMQGWTSIDADGDGNTWGMINEMYSSTTGHDSDNGVASQSYYSGALTPDNYLVSPQMTLSGTLTFWAAAYSTSFAAEHFGVAVSTASGTNPADFTMLNEWTMTAKGMPQGGSRDRADRVGTWYQYTVDLSAYEGQTGYIAIRHFNCSDEWALLVDDIQVEAASRSFQSFNVYRKNELTDGAVSQIAAGITDYETNDLTWGNAATGIYRWGVSAVYAGNRGESEITWSNAIDKDMTTTVNVTVATNSNDAVTGAVVTLTNINEPETVYTTTLDETGTYSWTDFRKGEYNVSVELDGFTPVAATESIWGVTNLNYTLNEIINNVEDLYVSTTGWAMFGEIPSSEPPVGMATITMNIGDVWGDGSGYQMLLDADANAFGTIIPATGPLSTNCSGNEAIYAEFEYKVPENADGNCSTQNIVLNNTISIQIPAGVYDWCITNPTPGDRIWIASAQGNVGGRQDDYVFEAGKTYTFSVYMMGSNDATDVTITDGKGVVANTVAPMPNNDAKNINDVVKVNNGYVVLPANTRSVEYYNVKLDGAMEGTTTLPFFQHNVEGLVEGSTHTTSVQKVYTTGESEWVSFDWVYTPCDNFAGLVGEPTAEWQGQDVVLNWVLPGGDGPTPPPTGNATITLTVGDVWGDGSGYQMLLDADANAFGSTIPTTGPLSTNCSGNESIYAEFEYKIPENADGNCSTQNIVLNNTISITIPAGTYDWCITNPTPGDRIWIAASQGNVGGRQNDYVFEAGKTYAFNVYMLGSNDATDVTITDGKGVVVANTVAPMPNNDAKNINDVVKVNNGYVVLPVMGNREVLFSDDFESGTLSNWTIVDNDGDGLNWEAGVYSNIGNAHSGSYLASSWSWSNSSFDPDNYMISPEVAGATSITYYVATNTAYPDHYGIFASTTGTNISDFTLVMEETAPASKGNANGTRVSKTDEGNRAMGAWVERTVALPAGTKYVAFRHYNSYDMNFLFIDDVTIMGGGVTPVDPVTPSENVLGVEIFRNGEWLAEVQAPAQTYTDVAVDGAADYEIRVVYDGPKEEYLYYAMSCPQAVSVEDNPCIVTPDNLTGTYEYVNGTEFGALINWTYGEGSEWFYYDDGTPATSVGEGDDHLPLYWGIMVPASNLNLYNGFSLTRVAFFETDATGTATINIYQGGSNAPGTLIHTQDVEYTGALDWHYVDLTANVPVDVNQNLWITMYNNGDIEYPAVCSENTGDPNGRWISEDGTNWMDVANAGINYTWMVRGFVTNAVEPDELTALAPFNGGGNTTMSFSNVELNANATEFNFGKTYHRDPVSFNVYRNGNVVGNVPYTGEYRYEYFDNVAAGNYEYQVTAVYDACESDFALTPDLSANYVEVTVTSVNETVDSRIYPNPTTGNVTIEANNMKHITVISTLGQVLYDANVSGDTYTMSLGQYQAGLYMVRIYTENGVSVKRVTLVK